MKQEIYYRWFILAVLVCVTFIGSFMLQVRFSQIGVPDVFANQPETILGFSGEEYSDTLPGIDRYHSSTYRWGGRDAQFDLWPGIDMARIITLRYISPYGDVFVSNGTTEYTTIPETKTIRTAHMLIPPTASNNIYFFTPNAEQIGNRTVGILIMQASWRGSTDMNWKTFPQQSWHTLGGVPFSIILLFICIWCLTRAHTLAMLGTIGVLVSVYIVGYWYPWHIIASQPTIQFVLMSVLIAYSCAKLYQLWQCSRFFGHIPASWWIIGIWCVSLLCYFRPMIQSDGAGYYAFARSVFVDGDIDFSNDFAPKLTPFLWPPDYGTSHYTGATINPFTVGPAIYWTPMWWISHMSTLAGKFAGLPWQADGYDMTYVVFITFATAVAGLGALFTIYQLLQRWYTSSVALLTTVTMYAGTNLLFYTVYEGSYAHALSAWLSAIVVTLACRLEHDQRLRVWLWCAGATAAFILTYWVNAIVAIVPILTIARICWQRYQQHDWNVLKRYGMYLIGMLAIASIVLAPQLTVWQVMQGAWYRIPRDSVRFTPQEFQLVAFFVGPLYGMVWWTPVYALGLIGLFLFARTHRWQGAVFILTCAVFIIYNTSIPNWHGSSGYGLRRLTSILPMLAIGFAHILQQYSRFFSSAWVLSATCIAWSLRLMLRYSEYKFQRGPDEFLQTLRVSLLSPSILPTEPFLHLQSLWWRGLWTQPTLDRIVISSVVVFMIGVTVYGILKVMGKVQAHG